MFVADGKLDGVLAAYKELAFDHLKGHPDCKFYSISKDERRGAVVTVSAWTSYDACVAAMSNESFVKAIQSMAGLLSDAPKPPEYLDLPVFASTADK